MSESGLYQPPWNFLGLDEKLADRNRARVWILPIPYESTTSYGAGTREGPSAIIAASRQVEQFDREFDCEPAERLGFHTLPPFGPLHRSPQAMVEAVAAGVDELLSGSPGPELLAILGGEHSISAGVARGLAKHAPEGQLVAVQIDAHADLRDQYEGCPYSHACAARRILDTCPVFQIGIRNISLGEEEFRRNWPRVTTVFAEEIAAGRPFLDELAAFVRGRWVYLTIDLDGLDPSIMPAVGTPEPDGLSWADTLDIVRVLVRQAARVPVFDVVELAPIAGLRSPDFLAARLVYKVASLVLLGQAAE